MEGNPKSRLTALKERFQHYNHLINRSNKTVTTIEHHVKVPPLHTDLKTLNPPRTHSSTNQNDQVSPQEHQINNFAQPLVSASSPPHPSQPPPNPPIHLTFQKLQTQQLDSRFPNFSVPRSIQQSPNVSSTAFDNKNNDYSEKFNRNIFFPKSYICNDNLETYTFEHNDNIKKSNINEAGPYMANYNVPSNTIRASSAQKVISSGQMNFSRARSSMDGALSGNQGSIKQPSHVSMQPLNHNSDYHFSNTPWKNEPHFPEKPPFNKVALQQNRVIDTSNQNNDFNELPNTKMNKRKKESRLLKLFSQRKNSHEGALDKICRSNKKASSDKQVYSEVMSLPSPSSLSPLFSSTNQRRQPSVMPVVESVNKSNEGSLGFVFLTFRDETKRSALPNEVTSTSTVWALFVRAFPDHLSMQWFDSNAPNIYILNPTTKLYSPLKSLREIKDRSALKVFELKEDSQDFDPKTQMINSPYQRHLSNRNEIVRSAPPIQKPATVPTRTTRRSITKLQTDQQHQLSPLSQNFRQYSLFLTSKQGSQQSSLSAYSDLSQVTIVKEPDFSHSPSTKQMPKKQDLRTTLQFLKQQALILKQDLIDLKQVHKENLSCVKKTLNIACSTCEEMIETLRKHPNHVAKKNIKKEKLKYYSETVIAENKLRDLEDSVNKMKNDVIKNRNLLEVKEVEQLNQSLNSVTKFLNHLKGRLELLKTHLKPMMMVEIGSVMQNERFVKGEPNRLEILLERCKNLSLTLSTLKKLALFQEKKSMKNKKNDFNQTTQSSSMTQLETKNFPDEANLQNMTKPHNIITSLSVSEPTFLQSEASWPTADSKTLNVVSSFYNTLFSADSQNYVKKKSELTIPCSSNYRNINLYSSHEIPQNPICSLTSSYPHQQPVNSPSLTPLLTSTQSAPNTPLMMMALKPPFQGLLGSFSKTNDISSTDSEYSVDLYSSSESSRLSSPDSTNKIPFILNHFLKEAKSDYSGNIDEDFLKEQSSLDSVFTETNCQDFQKSKTLHPNIFKSPKHRSNLINFNEKNYVDVTKAIRQMMKQNSKEKKSLLSGEYDDDKETKVNLESFHQHNTLKRAGILNDDTYDDERCFYESTCPYCFEEESTGRHKNNCPFLMHQEIMRLSKNANSKSDLEIGFCAKLSKSHLREQLKQRQELLRNRSNSQNYS